MEAQTLIDFLQTEDKEELISPLQTDPDVLKAHLSFRVYNHIHSFFEGYYRDGDFGYNDRSTAQYKVDYPDETDYNGADILFHWKCRDSYYVKTATGFNSVAFEIEGKRIEYRLEGKASSAVAQNSNQDNFKHYRFDRIEPPEPDNAEPTWRVILHLAETSTPKVEIYREMNVQIFGETDNVDIYLHERPKKNEEQDKPIFKDLADTYDKVQNGKLQGIKALQVNLTNYAGKLADRLDFRDKALGKNKTERQATLEKRPRVRRFHTFDKYLNTFFVGMDSDYFIHKDLDKFLKTEQRRYIQNTILGNLDTLLNLSPENPGFAIATAFRDVTDEVIALLVTVETFQKQLFLMKKKVITTDYLISIGKISEVSKVDPEKREALFSQILENEAQLDDWRDTFGIDIREQLPLLDGVYPTLPLDTRYFDEAFVDKLLALFDDLESQIDGVLLNSENFQALDLLMEKYRGSIRCVHIDPPYNTNTSGFLYKNDYQHSSWLTMMENRLSLAEQLMATDSCILCHIDENEYENLFKVCDAILLMDNQGTIIWDKRNPVFGTKTIATQHEYIVCYSTGSIKLNIRPINRKAILKEAASLIKKHGGVTDKCCKEFRTWIKNKSNLTGGEAAYSNIDENGNVYSEVSLSAPGLQNDSKYHIPLDHPDTEKQCPVPTNGWSRPPEKLQKLKDAGRIAFGKDEKKQPRLKIYLKDYLFGELSSVLPSGKRGKADMVTLGLEFEYCHSIDLYEYLVWAVTPDGEGIVLDFFAGSGTNGHAALNLNKADNGNRKFILIEMGDYFESTLKERIRRVMFSENWKGGKPDTNKGIDGTVGIVKYQRLEQYEDVLNNLTTLPPNDDTETELPVKYLYRPEEQQIRLMMDMRAPFSNRITYGKDSTEGVVDVLETYCYLKGLAVQRRLRFDFDDRVYRVIRSGTRAVVFRNVSDGMEDTEALLEILNDARLVGVTQLDVNYDANQNELLAGSDLRQIYIITISDFDSGSVWDTVEI